MNERLTIQDLTDLLAAKHGMTKKDAEAFVKEFFQLIEEALEKEKYVKIKGLGTFKLIDVNSRESVNVNTGERFQIQGHTKISFNPDTNLKDTINKPFAHFETVILNENTVLEDTPIEEIDEDEETPAFEASPLEISEKESGEESTTDDPSEVPDVEDTEVVKEVVEEVAGELTEEPSSPDTVQSGSGDQLEETGSAIKEQFTEEIIAQEVGPTNEVDSADVSQLIEENVIHASKEKSSVSYLIAIIIIVLLLCGGALLFIYYPGLFSSVSDKDLIEMPANQSTEQPSELLVDTINKKDTVAESVPTQKKDTIIEKQPIKVSEEPKPETVSKLSVPTESDTVTYTITGTKATYTIKEGETLTKVALRFYGTKAMWPYIVKYNRDVIKNPDNVPYGTVIKIPELVKK